LSDAQKLTARDAQVLWAIRAFFEANRYKTHLNFDEVLEACPENIVAGILRPILEHLESSRFLREDSNGLFSLTPLGLDLTDKRYSFDKSTFTGFCDLLLVALANHAEQQVTKFDAFDLRSIAELYALEFTPGWIDGASEVFEKRELAKIKRFSESEQDGLISAALTGPGLLEAERLRKELLERGITPPTYPPLDGMERVKQSLIQPDSSTLSDVGINKKLGSTDVVGFVPASDRIVRLDDNAPGRKEALENLVKIETALESGSNELKLTADERVVILSETRTLRQRLADGRVRLGALFQAIAPDGFLLLIIRKLAEDAIGLAANIVLSAIKTLLQVFR
jgi:hypothetical protein